MVLRLLKFSCYQGKILEFMSLKRDSYFSLLFLLLGVVFLIPLARPVFYLGISTRIILGLLSVFAFIYFYSKEDAARRKKFLALAISLGILALSAINTSLQTSHIISIASSLIAALIIPSLLLKGQNIIQFKFLPDRLDKIDIAYTLLAIPLAYFAFLLYFGQLSPEVAYNWVLPEQANNGELFKLFMGINAVGIWDELFFINVSFAILRSLFPFRTANLAQAIIYSSVLYQMAFSGWGPVFIFVLAITQGAMFERSRVLIWVLIVHLIVDFFLFQAIVQTYYPHLGVWWHPF